MQKNKGKKKKKLNLCGEKSEGVECWSPAKVEQARVFQETKAVQEAKELAEKEARKTQRAANALKNKQEKEAKAAERDAKAIAKQLAPDLEVQKPIALEAPLRQKKLVAVKARKTTPNVPNVGKAPTTSKSTNTMSNKSKQNLAEPNMTDVVVVGESSSGRKIVLPQRLKN